MKEYIPNYWIDLYNRNKNRKFKFNIYDPKIMNRNADENRINNFKKNNK